MERFLLSEQIPDKWTVNKAGKAVPAVRWELAWGFDWHSHEIGCKGAHSTDTIPSLHTLMLCSATTRQDRYLCQDQGKLKESKMGGMGLTTTQRES